MSFNFLANQDPFDQKTQGIKGTFDKFLEIQQNGQSDIQNFTLSSKFPGPHWMAEVGVWLASQKFWPKYFELKLNQYFDGSATIDQVIALFEAMFFEGIVEIGGERKTILNHYLDFVKVIDKVAYNKYISFLENKFGEFEVMSFESGGLVILRDIRTNKIYNVEQTEKVFLKVKTLLLTRIYKLGLIWHFTEGFVAAKFIEKSDKEKLHNPLDLSQLDSIFNFYKLQELQEKIDILKNMNYEELLSILYRKICGSELQLTIEDVELELKDMKTRRAFAKKYLNKFQLKNISLQESIILNALFNFLYISFPNRLNFIKSKLFKDNFVQRFSQMPETLQQSFAEFGIEVFDKNPSNIEFIEIANDSKNPDLFAKTKDIAEFQKYFADLNAVSQIQAITNHLREDLSNEFRIHLLKKLNQYLLSFDYFSKLSTKIHNQIVILESKVDNIKADEEKLVNKEESLTEKSSSSNKTKQSSKLDKQSSSQIITKAISQIGLEDKLNIGIFGEIITQLQEVLIELFDKEITKEQFNKILSKFVTKNSRLTIDELEELITQNELIINKDKVKLTTLGKIGALSKVSYSEAVAHCIRNILLNQRLKAFDIYNILYLLSTKELTLDQLASSLKYKTISSKNKLNLTCDYFIKIGILEIDKEKLKLSSFGNIILGNINIELKSLIPIGLSEEINYQSQSNGH